MGDARAPTKSHSEAAPTPRRHNRARRAHAANDSVDSFEETPLVRVLANSRASVRRIHRARDERVGPRERTSTTMMMRASALRSAVRAASKTTTTTNDAGRKPVARGMSATTACVGRRGRAARGRGAATRAAAAAASEETATDREPVKLLTSDESDNLLRIRHTVRARRGEGGDEGDARAGVRVVRVYKRGGVGART